MGWKKERRKWEERKKRYISIILFGLGGLIIPAIVRFLKIPPDIIYYIDFICILVCIGLIIVGFVQLVRFYIIKEKVRRNI